MRRRCFGHEHGRLRPRLRRPLPGLSRTGGVGVGQRWLALALIAVMGGGLTACGDAPPGAPSSVASAPAAPVPSVSTSPERSPRPSAVKKSRVPSHVRTLAAIQPSPSAPEGFRLVVKTSAGDVSVPVAPLSVASNELVDPPHETSEQWNTAAWIQQAAYPSVDSTGTTYIYGHACRHFECAFNDLKFANAGDAVVITTPERTLTYAIDRIGLSSKSASSLPRWASDSTIRDRIILVTCEIENGELTPNNLVLSAELR